MLAAYENHLYYLEYLFVQMSKDEEIRRSRILFYKLEKSCYF